MKENESKASIIMSCNSLTTKRKACTNIYESYKRDSIFTFWSSLLTDVIVERNVEGLTLKQGITSDLI